MSVSADKKQQQTIKGSSSLFTCNKSLSTFDCFLRKTIFYLLVCSCWSRFSYKFTELLSGDCCKIHFEKTKMRLATAPWFSWDRVQKLKKKCSSYDSYWTADHRNRYAAINPFLSSRCLPPCVNIPHTPSKWLSTHGDQRASDWLSLHMIDHFIQVIQAPTLTRLCFAFTS